MLKIVFIFNEETNGTEPSPSVGISIPCWGAGKQTGQNQYVVGGRAFNYKLGCFHVMHLLECVEAC